MRLYEMRIPTCLNEVLSSKKRILRFPHNPLLEIDVQPRKLT